MDAKNLSINDAFGLHSTRQILHIDPQLTPSDAKAVAWGYNFRKILSYLPIISTIVGIMTTVMLLFKERCPVRTGLIIRSLTLDLLSLGLIALIVDTIITLTRTATIDHQIRNNHNLR